MHVWRRLAALAIFSALATWTMFPVLLRLDAALAGSHLGDNATALWNVWWFRYAIDHAQPPYWTSMLFAPFGTQLSLHTHATTHSLIAWPLAAFSSTIAGHNLAVLVGLALNGFCAWMLAFRATGRFLPGIVAGLLFSFCAFVQLHVLGHINLVHAWVLPLFALAVIRLTAHPRVSNALAVGLTFAVVVYTDYYFAVYAGIFAAVWLAVLTISARANRRPGRFRRAQGVLLALMVVDILVIAVISFTGGTALDLGVATISLRGLRNPLTVFWCLLLAWGMCRYPVSLSTGWRSSPPSRRAFMLTAIATAVAVILTVPVWTALLGVLGAGDYTTQRVFWRSSPAGVDALTLALGHPRHLLTGEWTTSAYAALGVDVMEQSLWLGIVPLVLIVARRRECLQAPGARVWAVVGIVFFLLALGPFLRAGGFDTGLPLPQAALRYLPVFSNARIPGRAAVMVHLAIAMLTAFALASRRNRASMTALIALLLAIETIAAPAPAQPIPMPDAVDMALRASAAGGAVAELPLGIRDGFGQSGELDHRALVHQLWHERPLAGGFVARLPERVRLGYAETPLLNDLLAISTPSTPGTRLPTDAAARAAALGIAFIVVNRDTFIGDRLPRSAMEGAGFTFMQAAGARELYASTLVHAQR